MARVIDKYGEGNGNPPSTLAWKIPWTEKPGATDHGVTKSQILLRDFTFTFIDKLTLVY